MENNSQNIPTKFKIVPFYDVALWDVKRFFDKVEIFNKNYSLKAFGYFAKKPIIKKIKIEDDKYYKIVGVRSYGKGAYANRISKGSDLTMKMYQAIEKNYLYWCKVDTKNGAFGIINDDLADGVASTNMAFLELDTNKISTKYLQLFFKNPQFYKYLDSFVSGTTNRQYIHAQDLLDNIKIPLPTISEQTKIVNDYQSKITLAEQQEAEATILEKEIERYLLEKLGVFLEKKERKKGLNFSDFELIDRWATDYIFNTNAIAGIFNGTYPTQRVNDILLDVQYGLSEKASVEPVGTPMLRMNNILNAELYIKDLKYLQLPDKQKDKSLLQIGDLLFNRTNSKELVGKTAVFDLEGEYTYASYLIRLKVNTNKVNNYYINYLFNSSIGRTQIDMVSRQVLGQANVNTQEIGDFVFPIPPLAIQEEIVTHIQSLKAQIKTLRQAATANRSAAMQEFEQAIFNT